MLSLVFGSFLPIDRRRLLPGTPCLDAKVTCRGISRVNATLRVNMMDNLRCLSIPGQEVGRGLGGVIYDEVIDVVVVDDVRDVSTRVLLRVLLRVVRTCLYPISSLGSPWRFVLVATLVFAKFSGAFFIEASSLRAPLLRALIQAVADTVHKIVVLLPALGKRASIVA